jgi:hypothetical protein
VDSSLRHAALRDDGHAWAQAWQALDAGVLAQLLAEHKRGEPVNLTLCGDRGARTFVPQGRGLGAWVRGLFSRVSAPQVLEAL